MECRTHLFVANREFASKYYWGEHSFELIMARKKSKSEGIDQNESKVTPILEISQSDPLFTTAAHPTKPIIATGLGTGHLFCYSYDDEKLEERVSRNREAYLNAADIDKDNTRVSLLKKRWWLHETDHASVGSNSPLTINWKTKRHKGSCRSVAFDVLENSVGEHIYSIGTDHMVKKAATETGRVVAKTDFSAHLGEGAKDMVTTMALSTTHPFLLAGTENGNVLVFDSAKLASPELKFKCDNVHEDAVTKILPMPAVSPYHYLSLGSTVLSHIDIRKGIVTQSDDQSDELLSMCYPTDYVFGNKNDTVVVGHGEGIVTLWRNSTNRFMDQISRIKVNKNASIDAVISPMNSGDENLLDSIWCGDSDGLLHRINYKRGRVVETRAHSYLGSKLGITDEVSGLDIDYDYRLISSGMESLKIWSRQSDEDFDKASDSDDSDSELDDSDSDDEGKFSSDDGLSGSNDSNSDIDDDDDNEDDAKDPVGGSDSEVDEDESDQKSYQKKYPGVMNSYSTAKKKKININRPLNPETEVVNEPENKKRKIKQKTRKIPNNGIAKFDGL